MKQTPEEAGVAARMAPGVLTQHGFLGRDLRSLPEILLDDEAEVEYLGTTHAELAARLREVLDAAMAGLGAPVLIADRLSAVYREAMGRIPCPWGHGRLLPKGEIDVADRLTGHAFRFTPLSVHMVAAHGFYEGHGSRYRLEPAVLCHVFSLGRYAR